MTITFGTDGWRAVISDDFTFANVRHVAQGIADTLREDAGAGALAVVGFDTRFLSDRYAIAVSEVLAANGLRVALARADAPTPVVSFAIPHLQAAGGVMITASHNPPRYNGIKLKAAFGGGANNAQTRRVEARIAANMASGHEPQRMELADALAQGLVERFDPFPAYRDHVWRLVDRDAIRRGGLRIVVDAMYGSGRGYLRSLLAEAGAEVVEIRGEMNPGFNGIHPEPIAKHLKPLIEMVPQQGFDLGLAMDGDADRTGAVGPTGQFIDPHGIMALALRYLVDERQQRGDVVKTVSTTQMVNRLARDYGLAVHETPVGFNYIADLMLTNDVLIGGEESGGISIKGHIPEGDGVLMGLLLAELVAVYGKSPEALLADIMAQIGPFSYARNDFRVQPFNKAELVSWLVAHAPDRLADVPVASINTRDGVKYLLADDSWLLIRPSGTEPVLRVYAEAHTPEMVQTLLAAGRALADAAGV
ncbi:MAG: phosphoglucomutase/phosphomannomutase family protein [Anaerolineae bacterium]|nr:phosphoglucomutase/phosphomannomutase family protein [Anaerolineae bacterium]